MNGETGTPSFRDLLKEPPLWILVLLVVAVFYRPLFLGDVFFYRDLSAHFLPCKKLLVELVGRGELPFWNPYLQGGAPFMANPNNMVLYPSGVLYFIFSPTYALALDMVGHLMLGIAGMYFLARTLGFSKTSGFAAAVVYGFCGPGASLGCFLIWMAAFSVQPWIFLFWHRYLTGEKKRYFVCAAIGFTLQLLAGVPEFYLFTAAFVLVWTLLFPYTVPWRQRLLRFGLVLLFAMILAAIQILPAIELARISSRSALVQYSFFTLFSINPMRYPELFLNGFLGRFDVLGGFWGQAISSQNVPFLMSVYFGPVALYLFAMSLFVKNGRLPNRIRNFCAIAFVCAVLLATGKYLPGFSLIYRFVPFVTFFRNPSKIFLASVLPMAILVAYSLEFHFGPSGSVTSKKSLRILWPLLALFVLALAASARGDWASAVLQSYFQQASTTAMQKGLFFAWLQTSILLLALCVVVRTNRQRLGLVILLTIDLLWSGRHINFFAPPDMYATPAIVPVIKQDLDQGKLYRTEYPAGSFSASFPTPDRFWEARQYDEILDGYFASNHGIPVIFHSDIDGSAPLRMLYYQTVLKSVPWKERQALLAAAGVTLVLSGEPIPEPSMTLITYQVSSSGSMPLYLYRVPHALPPVSFVSSWVFRSSDKEEMAAMMSPGYDARRFVVLPGSKTPVQFHRCEGAVVRAVLERINSSRYEVQAPCDGYVVFPRPFHSGWRCDVDGHAVSQLRANLIFSAVPVSAGKHTVSCRYLPSSTVVGFCLSAVGLLALLFLPPRLLFFSR